MLPTTEALVRERELVARFRLRLARTASRVALIVIGAIGVCAMVEPIHNDDTARIALWSLLAVAAAISLAIHARTRPGGRDLPLWAFYVWTAGVLLFDSAVVYLYGTASSDIYLVYVLPVLFAAATLPTWGAVAALASAVLAYLAIVFTIDGEIARDQLVMRAATFAVIGLLGAYLAREQQREIGIRVQQEQHLAQLLGKTVSAQEDERKRIARDLHDGPLQSLSMVSMQLGRIEELPPADFARSQARVSELRAALRRQIKEVRRLTQDLRPSALDDLGLVTAVHDFAARRCGAAGLELRWDVTGRIRPLAPPVETAVFRILQEAVTNVVRHSRARSAEISLSYEDGRVRASVVDDGVGFDPRMVVARDDGGAGLYGMQERTELIGGTLAIDSAPARGTRLVAVIPTTGVPSA